MTIKDYSLVCKVLDIDMAKQCALIAVDEILWILNELQDSYSDNASMFYNEVKQEIAKL
jgi:hypothetical protein